MTESQRSSVKKIDVAFGAPNMPPTRFQVFAVACR